MSSDREAVSLGLVGCGRLAEAGYIPALAGSGARIMAVADPDPGRRARVAQTAAVVQGRENTDHRAGTGSRPPKVPSFSDAATLLDEVGAGLDGLILASPVTAHLADARLAVGAGLPVLVEKPPAVDATEAGELAALGSLARVAFNRRFDVGAQAVRAKVPTGDSPVGFRLELTYRRQSWGAHAVHDDALADLGPHLVDWALWLRLRGADRSVEVTCDRADGARAELDLVTTRGRARLRAATDRPHHELVELTDGSGRTVARHRIGGPVAGVLARLRPGTRPSPLVATLHAQLSAFAAAVRDGDPGELATGADGHAVMAVLDAARRSAADGGRTVAATLPESIPSPPEAQKKCS